MDSDGSKIKMELKVPCTRSSFSRENPTPLLELPCDLILSIYQHVRPQDLSSFSNNSRALRCFFENHKRAVFLGIERELYPAARTLYGTCGKRTCFQNQMIREGFEELAQDDATLRQQKNASCFGTKKAAPLTDLEQMITKQSLFDRACRVQKQMAQFVGQHISLEASYCISSFYRLHQFDFILEDYCHIRQKFDMQSSSVKSEVATALEKVIRKALRLLHWTGQSTARLFCSNVARVSLRGSHLLLRLNFARFRHNLTRFFAAIILQKVIHVLPRETPNLKDLSSDKYRPVGANKQQYIGKNILKWVLIDAFFVPDIEAFYGRYFGFEMGLLRHFGIRPEKAMVGTPLDRMIEAKEREQRLLINEA